MRLPALLLAAALLSLSAGARALPCDEMPPVAALLSAAPGEQSSPRFDPVSLAILQSLILSLAYAQ